MKGQTSDMNLRAIEQERARIEAEENLEGKAVRLLLTSTSVSQLLRQKKKEIEKKGMRRPFLQISRPWLLPKVKKSNRKL